MEVILLFIIAVQLWTGFNFKDVLGLIGKGAQKVADTTPNTTAKK